MEDPSWTLWIFSNAIRTNQCSCSFSSFNQWRITGFWMTYWFFSTSVETHRDHVRAVMQLILENRLFVKGEKCMFHAQTLGFLGFRVAPGRLKADPEKIKAVREWPKPNTRRRLQQFLNLRSFYRRFIRDYSRIATLLTRRTSPWRKRSSVS